MEMEWGRVCWQVGVVARRTLLGDSGCLPLAHTITHTELWQQQSERFWLEREMPTITRTKGTEGTSIVANQGSNLQEFVTWKI